MRRIFIQSTIFSRLLEEEGRANLLEVIEAEILNNPEAGDLIQGCGGVRKLRVRDGYRGKGKRGGLRVLYLDLPSRQRTFLLYMYGKYESENINALQKKQILSLVRIIKSE